MLVLITTGKISTPENLNMYYTSQNNNLVTGGNCSCYDAQSAGHRPVTLRGGPMVRYPSVHVWRADKEVAFEELSLRTPRFFPASIIPASLHNHNSFLYHVRCSYRPIYSAIDSVFK